MIDDRIHRVLWAVVDSYILNPDPVGSRFVTKKYAFNLSPATIRNIMADLEEMGFLHQPHTSAGRIPTDKGYRYYVDALSGAQKADAAAYRDLSNRLETIRQDITTLLGETTRSLSRLSHYVGVALTPKPDRSILRLINLIRYKERELVVVFLTEEGEVRNHFLRLETDMGQRDLSRIADYLNAEFAGRSVDEIKAMVLREMRRDKALCDSLIDRAITICRESLFHDYAEVFISGFSEVLGLPDFSDLQRIREISKAIEDKHMIIKLLDTLGDSEGVQVIIGSENRASEMSKLSMVASTYKEGDRPIGAIGVIGPTRMDYMRAIAIVDAAARSLTKIMTDKRPSHRGAQ